jgi:hypothetical protein
MERSIVVMKIEYFHASKYAILTTEAAPRPDKKTGRMPMGEGWQNKVEAFVSQILDDSAPSLMTVQANAILTIS